MKQKTEFNSNLLTIRLKYSFRQQILESGRVFLGDTVTFEARGVLVLGAFGELEDGRHLCGSLQ